MGSEDKDGSDEGLEVDIAGESDEVSGTKLDVECCIPEATEDELKI